MKRLVVVFLWLQIRIHNSGLTLTNRKLCGFMCLGHLPTEWKTAKIVLIPKEGRNHSLVSNHSIEMYFINQFEEASNCTK